MTKVKGNFILKSNEKSKGFLLKGINNLFFPNNCAACSKNLMKNEHLICLKCLDKLPFTNNHLVKDNEMEKILWGRIKFESAYALLYFIKKSKTQSILHSLKYKGNKEIGVLMGNLLGERLQSIQISDIIDIIIPLPIHPLKILKRGYNQSDYFAQGLSESLNIAWDNEAIIKSIHTESQTKKSRFNRWLNVEETFEVCKNDLLKNKHILLVDDVMTTGSTIEACAQKLISIEGVKISIATIAVTV